ncbi:MAG: transporter substrate-binding domain-containing protein [Oligoflexales bacterium]|nr:transporter substrate-binding domain-containing protein [Oligoflexales bacterium]
MICLYVASISSAYSKPLKIFSGEWPPYSSKNLPRGGVALSIISEAFANVDVTVEYVWAPWKRGFEGAKSGHEVFASSLWMKNDEREKHFYYTEPFIDQEHVFFHLKSKPIKWKKFSDLSDKGVLVVRGYS